MAIAKRSQALFSYLDWICFNLLIGNNDCHSKNLSFLLNDGKIELAPFYDLLCTAIYPKLKKEFSFAIGSRNEASRIGRNQFKMVDESFGLKEGTMGSRVNEIKEKLLDNKDVLAKEIKDELPYAKIVQRISALIEDLCRSLRSQGL